MPEHHGQDQRQPGLGPLLVLELAAPGYLEPGAVVPDAGCDLSLCLVEERSQIPPPQVEPDGEVAFGHLAGNRALAVIEPDRGHLGQRDARPCG